MGDMRANIMLCHDNTVAPFVATAHLLVQQRSVFVGDVDALLFDNGNTRSHWQTRMFTSVGQVVTLANPDGHLGRSGGHQNKLQYNLGRSGGHVGKPGWSPRSVRWSRWQTRMVTSAGQVATSANQDGHLGRSGGRQDKLQHNLGRSGGHVGKPGWSPRPVRWAGEETSLTRGLPL